MATYYRFQNDKPRVGETVHCFRTRQGIKDFAEIMRAQDPYFNLMKFWEIEGKYIRPDEDDVVIRVTSVRQIRL